MCMQAFTFLPPSLPPSPPLQVLLDMVRQQQAARKALESVAQLKEQVQGELRGRSGSASATPRSMDAAASCPQVSGLGPHGERWAVDVSGQRGGAGTGAVAGGDAVSASSSSFVDGSRDRMFSRLQSLQSSLRGPSTRLTAVVSGEGGAGRGREREGEGGLPSALYACSHPRHMHAAIHGICMQLTPHCMQPLTAYCLPSTTHPLTCSHLQPLTRAHGLAIVAEARSLFTFTF